MIQSQSPALTSGDSDSKSSEGQCVVGSATEATEASGRDSEVAGFHGKFFRDTVWVKESKNVEDHDNDSEYVLFTYY